jgi:hypothetical protein
MAHGGRQGVLGTIPVQNLLILDPDMSIPEALRPSGGSKTLFGRYGEKFTNPRKANGLR